MKKTGTILVIVLLALSWYVTVSTAIGTPKEYKAHLEKAKAYEKKEIYEDAILEYEAALAIEPENIEIDLKIAEDYMAMFEEESFVSQLENTISKYENNEKAVMRLVEYYEKEEQPASALRILKAENKKQPDNKEIAKKLEELKGSYRNMYCTYEDISRIWNGYAVVKSDEGYGIIDSVGGGVLSPNAEEIGLFGKEIPYAPIKQDGKWSYVNSKNHKKLVPDDVCDWLGSFSDGVATACIKGQYGYFDKNLEKLCDFEYDYASNMYNGVAAVKKGKKWAIIGDNFKFVTDFIYDDIAVDELGYCSVNERLFVKQNNSYYMVDTKGEKISDLTFEDCKPFVSTEPTVVKNNGKWGFINERGEVVINYKYEEAKGFKMEFAPVKINGLWGYIDLNNKVVIDAKFEDANPFYDNGVASVKNENWTLIQLNLYQ